MKDERKEEKERRRANGVSSLSNDTMMACRDHRL